VRLHQSAWPPHRHGASTASLLITAEAMVSELAILISSASPEGPFVKAAQVTVPNYRNMEKPLHELHFTPVEARFVKVQVVSLQNDHGPNGNLGSLQLYASTK
jgi:hypothetical protein